MVLLGGLSREGMCIGAFAEGGVSGSLLESGDRGTDQVARSDPQNLLCLLASLESTLTSAGEDGRERENVRCLSLRPPLTAFSPRHE